MERLFRGLEAVDESGLADWTLIGGLAVMARLAVAHRATADIDTLVRDAVPNAKAVLLTVAAEATASGVRLLPFSTSTGSPIMATRCGCSRWRTGGWQPPPKMSSSGWCGPTLQKQFSSDPFA
jgi:hypothetical protein